MTLKVTFNNFEFGVGDKIRVSLKISEGGKSRAQIFEGMVIAIKNRGETRTFTVRRIGVQQIGIERIFPLFSPLLEKVEVIKKGLAGVRRSKLYYTREQSPREVDKIYSRSAQRQQNKSGVSRALQTKKKKVTRKNVSKQK
jgi:large subunit ribosomal protein L19